MYIAYPKKSNKADLDYSRIVYILAITLLGFLWIKDPAFARVGDQEKYSLKEIIQAGSDFFGSISGGLAKVAENAFEKYGLPNGYILGQEGSGAFIAGVTYGEGVLNTKNAGKHTLFWQGPSLGLDLGGNGSRCMMLVYNLSSVDAIYSRYGSVSGSAFIVAGISMTVLRNNDVIIVPIRTGIGLRLGLNAGYLKITPIPTWNPF